MENELISIVIPIYNSEKYILECIESIKQQSYHQLQVILVDDGSTDNSKEICKKICAEDKRFHYFYQENQGPSAARNLGLERVTGDYLMFVDADDLLEKNAIFCMLEYMTRYKADLIVAAIETFGGKKKEKIGLDNIVDDISVSEYISEIASDDKKYGGGFTVAKLWRVNAIKENNQFIHFSHSLKLYEDKLWAIENAKRISTIVLLPTIVYQYRILENSLSHKKADWHRKQILLASKRIMESCQDFCNEKEMKKVEVMYAMQLMRGIYEKKVDVDEAVKNWIERCVFAVIYTKNISLRSKFKYIYVYIHIRLNSSK